MESKKIKEDPKLPFLTCQDYTVSGEKFELRYNPKMELLETFPKPGLAELPTYYKSEKYISHTDSSSGVMDKIYQWVKHFMLDKKIKWIEAEKGDRGKLLDIGAGTGDFLVKAKTKNWNVDGVEPNPEARNLAAKKGIGMYKDTENFSSSTFDVITMWHVLEHVPDLDLQINELFRLLKNDGLLVIAVPNFKSWDAQKYNEHWAAFDVP
ncbi:MAG TPA: class I SAM-dependent methyltransferase, partial [Salinimicrobium sp.]|nr:class I SAM-dependent methyltransferase [Salinimicrobium sp.]